MKLNNTLRAITAVVALMAATPSAQAEQMTDDQRACVQRVLKNPNADADAARACLSVDEAGSDDPDKAKKELAPDSLEAHILFATLEVRFSKETPFRPDVVKFADVKKSLEARPDLLYSLNQMEKTGGEPDVIAVEGDAFVFADASKESPEGRRNLNYDQAKKMADEMGVEMMDEATYRNLQAQFRIDTNTWSWLFTDAKTKTRARGRALGGRGYNAKYSVKWDFGAIDTDPYVYDGFYDTSHDSGRGWRASPLRIPRS